MPIIEANWPKLTDDDGSEVTAFCTTRLPVVPTEVESPIHSDNFASFNMGLHVGDDSSIVQKNRAQLLDYCGLEGAQWLNQVHGTACVKSGELTDVTADACWTDQDDLACIVMTADCLPVVFRHAGAGVGAIAAAHAGWRGLLHGVLESTLVNFDTSQVDIWLGPAIGPQAFEVGPEVREQFVAKHAQAVEAFLPSPNTGKWLADIYKLARITLQAADVNSTRIFGGEYCTYSDEERFYSYRRTAKTGRLATVVYRTKRDTKV